MRDATNPDKEPEIKIYEPSTVSVKGIKAIQGFEDSPSSEGQIQKAESLSRLQDASQKADVHIPKRGDGEFAQVHEFYEVGGRTGEELAKANTPNAANLNDVLGKHNVPNYDITSPEGLASVKVMRTKDGEPRYGTYASHFRNMVNPESHKNQLFAKDILNARETNSQKWQELSKCLPPNVANADDSVQIAKASAESSMLKISPDQMLKVRDDLIVRIKENPQYFGFNSTMTPDAIRGLVEKKIQPFDPNITANDIDAVTAISMNKRHGKKSFWARSEST